jgi:DNA-binding CsgD family transcriptional regulator
MTEDQIAFVADALLALSRPDPQRPTYDEWRPFPRQVPTTPLDAVWNVIAPYPVSAYFDRQECAALLELARLTPSQEEVLAMRLEGFTFEQIGRRRSITKQGVQKVFIAALKKLRVAWRVYPLRGLAEVYRAEIRRGR